MEDPARPPLSAVWQDQNTLRVSGAIPRDALVYVQVSHHPGWRATQDGRPLPIKPDALGFMVIKAAAAPQSAIELRYTGTLEQRVMAGLSALAWIAALAGLFANYFPVARSTVRNDSAT